MTSSPRSAIRVALATLTFALALLGAKGAFAQTPPPSAPASPTPPPAEPPPPGMAPAAPPLIDPAGDQAQLAAQGQQAPANLDGSIGVRAADVYAPDWWGGAHPSFELHGYFRTRAELFQNFALGRHNSAGDNQYLWSQPVDNTFTANNTGKAVTVALCGSSHTASCTDSSQASANLRFRLNPEIHVSSNLRILSQIDLLDNLVLGSTPDSYATQPGTGANGNGYTSAGYNAYAPLGFFSTTQGPPTAGINGFQNSVQVNRVWAEYTTPVGELRFGRMPSQWGLGMVSNAGDGIDSDYQTTVDRIMFVTGWKAIDTYIGGAWDFVSTGTNDSNPYTIYGGQPYSNANLENVGEWVAFLVRRTSLQKTRQTLAQGGVVLNGGAYFVYRTQELDVADGQTPYTTTTACTAATCNNGLQYRGASAAIPDLWFQALWNKLRFEAEFAGILGKIDHTPQSQQTPTQVREYGLVTQTEYRMLKDKLRLDFGFGWASGDPRAPSLNPGPNGLQSESNITGPVSTFRFHPDYRVDLIFFREILTRVEGAYYFRPSVDYDFIRQENGQKFGGGAAFIWSRASSLAQSPSGTKADLGAELDFQLVYQASDGGMNDDLDKVGGFYAMLQYGVLFPLPGLDYTAAQQASPTATAAGINFGLSPAQAVRLYLGVVF